MIKANQMNFLGIIFLGSLTLSFLVSTQAWAFTIVSYPPEIANRIPEINRMAKQILTENAALQIPDPDGILTALMDLKMSVEKVSTCPINATMWTDVESKSDIVFICPETIEAMQTFDSERGISVATQVFLHEAIHRIGYDDECFTTRLELFLSRNKICNSLIYFTS